MIRTPVLLALSVLLGASCVPIDESLPDDPWGAEAVAFFDEKAAATCAHDFHGLVRFYSADTISDSRAIMIGKYPGGLREGRQATMSYLEICFLSAHSNIVTSVDDVFLTRDGAIVIERWTQTDDERLLAALVEIGPGGIDLIRYFPSRAHVAEVEIATTPVIALRHQESIDVHASLEAVDQFIAEQRARRTDELEVYPILDVAGVLHEAIAVVGNEETPCRTALWWAIRNGEVVDERRYVGVGTASSCDPADLGTGWWNGLSLPTPLDQRLSEEIQIDGQTIALYNSDNDRRALVKWAYDRFAIHGFDMPVVDRIVFEPSAPCRGLAGLARVTSEKSAVYVCIEDIVCRHSACSEYSDSAKRAILHELAHIWMHRNLDAERRKQFMVVTDTLTWDDEAVAWHEQGVEWAAETIAWALSDEQLQLIRLSFPPCEVLSEGFLVLADQQAPWNCSGAT